MNEIYTIGYTTFPLDEFINILKKNGITCLIDVRSTPKSSYYTDFNKDQLEKNLKGYGILYRNYAVEFGARQDNKDFYPNGYLDFETFSKSEQFLDGIKKVKMGEEKFNQTFALMCAEKDPFNCHRCILVGRAFRDNGFNVKHIVTNGEITTQEDIDNRLIDFYYPNKNQLSIFSEENLSREEMLKNAYKKRNADIGFKIEGEDK